MRAHDDYLDALTQSPRSKDRGSVRAAAHRATGLIRAGYAARVARLQAIPLEKIPGGRGFAALSRRVRTLIVAGVLFLVLFVLALTMPVPYVILSPGPTYNTLGTDDSGNTIIVIHGTKPTKRAGNLNLTTVGVSGESVSAFEALAGWLAHDQVVVPSSAVYPPGQSQHDTDVKNTADFVDSQDNAITAASCELGYPHRFGVVSVQSEGAAHDKLQPADVLRTVDGKPVTSAATLHNALAAKPPKTVVSIGLTRAGNQRTVDVKLGPAAARPLRGHSRDHGRRRSAQRRSASISAWPTKSAARRPG